MKPTSPPAPTNTRDIATETIVAAARPHFLRGERLDLPQLADELGISRATLYRRIGNLEQLQGEVIAALVADTHRRVLGEARGRGARRVLDYLERGMRFIAAFEPLQWFLEKDPNKGLRIIASREGPVQSLTIALTQELLDEEIARGNLALAVDTHTMAYALTRTVESFLYADFIAGETPDIDSALPILALMLGLPARRRRAKP